jgi:hypothetical protein
LELLLPKKIMKRLYLLLIPFLIFSTQACRTGKRTLEKGNYDQAVRQAAKRLKNNPDSKKAKQTLPLAYNYALDYHLTSIQNNKNSGQVHKWDNVVNDYEQLNSLYRALQTCPACLSLVTPKFFTTELSEAKLNASKVHFQVGQKQMAKKNVMSARSAYDHFLAAKRYTPQYDKIDQWINASLDAASINVIIKPIGIHSRRLALSNEFFENQIKAYAKGMPYRFVRFYDEHEAANLEIEADQIILLRFDDFVVGQTYVKETVENVTRDSVVIGTTKTDEGDEVDVFGTVKAKVRTYKKEVVSSGLLDFQIIDAVSGATLKQRKLPGTYVWFTEWGSYNGQEEALSDEQLSIMKHREAFPPPPQDLFIEFTRPIYGQITQELKRYYRSHN